MSVFVTSVPAVESAHQGREYAVADGYAGADAQGCREIPVAHIFLHIVKHGYDMQRIPVEFVSDLSGVKAPRTARPIFMPGEIIRSIRISDI